MEKTKSWGGKRENAGRKPYMDDADKKRIRSIMLTDNENDRLTQLAKDRGLTRSQLIAEWINQN